MFPTAKRTILFLLRTPLVSPTPAGPAAVELTSFSSSASAGVGPSRLGATRTLSGLSVRPAYGTGSGYEMRRGYASDHGKKELYSDEAGSTGAGIDDVAHTDAAFNKDANPETSSKQVEQESGKDATSQSPANPDYSHPPGKQGEKGSETPLNTSKTGSKK